MKKWFTEQQIVAILKEGEAGVPSKEIRHKQTLQSWGFVSASAVSGHVRILLHGMICRTFTRYFVV